MKIIQKTLLISLVPLFTPVTVFAEVGKQSELVTPVPGTKVSPASWRASQVMGVNVKNTNSETIGEVEDLVLDMKSGEILAVVISSGGFLGMGDTLSAVPVTALRYDDAAKGFMTRLTKDQLGKAPQFKNDAWPDYNDDASKKSLRTYRDSISDDATAPDNTTHTARKMNKRSDTNTAPDNTARNARKMNKRADTATDQGDSAKDVQITKDIRSAIMDKDLSTNAGNIKIITRNERVTLTGVVDSDAEHQAILKIARNHAKTASITDELTVDAK